MTNKYIEELEEMVVMVTDAYLAASKTFLAAQKENDPDMPLIRSMKKTLNMMSGDLEKLLDERLTSQ